MWQWAQGGWERTELRDLIETAFENPKALKDMGLDWRAPRLQVDRQQLMASTTVEFTFALASNRCWSMLVYKFAPFSYSGILVTGDENKEADMEATEQWKTLSLCHTHMLLEVKSALPATRSHCWPP